MIFKFQRDRRSKGDASMMLAPTQRDGCALRGLVAPGRGEESRQEVLDIASHSGLVGGFISCQFLIDDLVDFVHLQEGHRKVEKSEA